MNGYGSSQAELIRIGDVKFYYSRMKEGYSHTDEAKAHGAVDNGFYIYVAD
jgi:hypothetical protein